MFGSRKDRLREMTKYFFIPLSLGILILGCFVAKFFYVKKCIAFGQDKATCEALFWE